MKFILFTLILSLNLFYTLAAHGKTHRLISLSPAITEIVFSLGFEKHLVGVSEFSDFPIAAKKITSVGPYSKPNVEKIVSLMPTLVLLPAEGTADIAAKLNQLKIKFHVLTIKKLEHIGESAVQIANILERSEVGIKFKKIWEKQLEEGFKNPSKGRFPTIIVIQTAPIIVAATNTFLNEIVTRCGGQNVFSTLEGYPKIPQEAVLNKNPKIIFLAEHFNNEDEKSKALEFWNKIDPTIFVIDPDIAARPGPRIIEGVRKICGNLKEVKNVF